MSELFATPDIDQAAGLRRLFGSQQARVMAFASGHEACGRTTLLVRTGLDLAAAGESVLLIDENTGSSTIRRALKADNRHDLLDWVRGECALDRLPFPVAPRLSVIAAADFAAAATHSDARISRRLEAGIRQLREGCSFILIDCAVRNGLHLSPLAMAASHMVVVVAAQGTAITKAYALIKRLAQERGCDGFHVVITRARNEQEALAIFHNLRETALRHLGVRIAYLGSAKTPAKSHLAVSLQNCPTPFPAALEDRQAHMVSVATKAPAGSLRPLESML